MDKILLILFAVVVSCSFQLTDVKFFNVKITEILMLLMFPLMLGTKQRIFIYYFLALFTLELVLTFLLNLNRQFYLPPDLTLLKRPYLISISRYLELISCISFSMFVYNALIYFVDNRGYDISTVFRYVVYANLFFAVFFLLAYFYYRVNHFSLDVNSFIVHNPAYMYDSGFYRIRGFYFEGGPLGLCFAFVLVMSTMLPNKHILIKCILLLTILLASSKAGMLMIVFWLLFYFLVRYRIDFSTKILLFSLSLLVFGVSFKFIAANYFESLESIESIVQARPDDYALVMGRVSGLFFVPKMVLANPLFGIGLGNYPLVRNNPDYLGFFPPVDLWDDHGLGGIVSTLVDGGFFLIGLFFVIIYLIYRELSVKRFGQRGMILLFLIPSLLGVQLHFMYPWFIIATIIFITKTKSQIDLKLKIL